MGGFGVRRSARGRMRLERQDDAHHPPTTPVGATTGSGSGAAMAHTGPVGTLGPPTSGTYNARKPAVLEHLDSALVRYFSTKGFTGVTDPLRGAQLDDHLVQGHGHKLDRKDQLGGADDRAQPDDGPPQDHPRRAGLGGLHPVLITLAACRCVFVFWPIWPKIQPLSTPFDPTATPRHPRGS